MRGVEMSAGDSRMWWAAGGLVALLLLSSCGQTPTFSQQASRGERLASAYDAVASPAQMVRFGERTLWAGKCTADGHELFAAALQLDATDRSAIVLKTLKAEKTAGVKPENLAAEAKVGDLRLGETVGGAPVIYYKSKTLVCYFSHDKSTGEKADRTNKKAEEDISFLLDLK